MDYEQGKWLERIEYKLDLILQKLYPDEFKDEKKK